MLKQSLEDQMGADNKEKDDQTAAKSATEETKATAEGDLTNTEKDLADAENALKARCSRTRPPLFSARNVVVTLRSLVERLQDLDCRKMNKSQTSLCSNCGVQLGNGQKALGRYTFVAAFHVRSRLSIPRAQFVSCTTSCGVDEKLYQIKSNVLEEP